MQKKCAKTFKKLEKKGEDLEKELEKTKSAKMDLSTDDTIEAHHKKKEIDLEAFAAKKKVEHQLQEKKKAKMKKTMSKCFGDAKTLYMSGRSFSDRLGPYLGDSDVSSYCSLDESVSCCCKN